MANCIVLGGRLGRDVEIVETSGSPIAKFTLATDNKYKNKTLWHNIVAYGAVANICGKLLCKGSFVNITGELDYDEYTDKQGVHRKVANIIANKVELVCGGKPREESATNDDPLNDEFPL